MRIRTEQEVSQIDASLELISEDVWDFFDVKDDDENAKYFNDIQAQQMKSLGSSVSLGVFVLSIIGVIFICFVVFIGIGMIMASRDNSDYERVKNISAGVTDQVESTLVGNDISKDDMLSVSMVLQDYFVACQKIVDNADTVKRLCNGNSSVYSFADESFNDSQSMFDESDCFYRVLQFQLSSIQDMIISQAVYSDANNSSEIICSVRLKWVSGDDLVSWVLANQVNINKFATKNGVSRALAMRYLLINADNKSSFSTSQDYVTFTVKKVGDEYYLDDAKFKQKCVDSCEKYIKQALLLMG